MHQILVPHGAYESPTAIQCVISMEKRRCLVRRKDSEEIQSLTGFYMCGVYCAKHLRGMRVVKEMILRLLCDSPKSEADLENVPFVKRYTDLYKHLPDT